MSFLLPWASAFCWTLAIETPIYALALRSVSTRRFAPVVVALLANLSTHPAFSAWIVAYAPEHSEILVAELAIALFEAALVYVALRQRCSPLRALASAAMANSTSYLVGELLLR